MSVVDVAQHIENALGAIEEEIPSNGSRELSLVRTALEIGGLFLSRLPGIHEAKEFRYNPVAGDSGAAAPTQTLQLPPEVLAAIAQSQAQPPAQAPASDTPPPPPGV